MQQVQQRGAVCYGVLRALGGPDFVQCLRHLGVPA